MKNFTRLFVISMIVLVVTPCFADVTHSRTYALLLGSIQEGLLSASNIADSNTIGNGSIMLSFYDDHVSYSFGNEVKKAIDDNGGSAGYSTYTNATEDSSELSADGNVTSDGGDLRFSKLKNGVFTFVVTTKSGDFKICCFLKMGRPLIQLNPSISLPRSTGEYLDYIENQDVCISVYSDNLKIILKKDAQKYILENDNDNDGAFISVTPTLGMYPGYEGTIDPAGVNYIPLRQVFQKGKSGIVLILIDNGENDNCVKCLVDILDGKIRFNN